MKSQKKTNVQSKGDFKRELSKKEIRWIYNDGKPITSQNTQEVQDK